MATYGLNITNGAGRYIVNGDNPLLGRLGTFSTVVIPGTNGDSVDGYYGVWAESGNILAAQSPLPMLPCNTGYTASYCAGDGFVSFITSDPDGGNIDVASPAMYATKVPGDYGLETYDASGNLIFSSLQSYPEILDMSTLYLSETDTLAISGGTLTKTHASASPPLYVVADLNAIYIAAVATWYAVGGNYYYYSWYKVHRVGVKNLSATSFGVNFPVVGSGYTGETVNMQSAGYGSYFDAVNLAASFGDMVRIYYAESLEGTAAHAIYRWSPKDSMSVLVCRR